MTSRLPVKGLPCILDWVAPFLFKKTHIDEITIGRVKLKIDLANALMRNMYFGIYEKNVIELMKAKLKNGSIFVDVGANIGYLAAQAASIVGEEGAVYCFEPVPEYSEKIKEMIESSLVDNITIESVAVGDKLDNVRIMISGKNNIGWNTVIPELMDSSDVERTLTVPMITLSSYFESLGVNKIDMIKIDVEGAEFFVLKGLKNYLSSGDRPVILCEICPEACKYLGTNMSDIFSFMASFGYMAYGFCGKGMYRYYTGKLKLVPIEPEGIRKTMDIVWMAT